MTKKNYEKCGQSPSIVKNNLTTTSHDLL